MAQTRIDTNSGFIIKNADSQFVQGVTESVLFEYLVKGGTLGRAKDVRLEIFGDLTTAALTTAPNLSINLDFGGNTLPILNAVKLSLDPAVKPFSLKILIGNRFDRGASNLQTVRSELLLASNMLALATQGVMLASMDTYLDLNSDAVLRVRAKFTNQAALPVAGGDELVKHLAIMEIK